MMHRALSVGSSKIIVQIRDFVSYAIILPSKNKIIIELLNLLLQGALSLDLKLSLHKSNLANLKKYVRNKMSDSIGKIYNFWSKREICVSQSTVSRVYQRLASYLSIFCQFPMISARKSSKISWDASRWSRYTIWLMKFRMKGTQWTNYWMGYSVWS